MPAHFLDEKTVSDICKKLRAPLTPDQSSVLDEPVGNGKLIAVTAVAGSGKTRTSAALVAEAMLDPTVNQITVMSSMRSAADTALARISETLEACGLAAEGYSFPKDYVRTIHSIALRVNKEAGRPAKVVASADSFLEAAIDEKLETARLCRLGYASFEAFWADSHGKASGVKQKMDANFLRSEFPDHPPNELGLLLYKKTFAEYEPVLRDEGFDEIKASALLASLKVIRREVLDKFVGLESVEKRKSELIQTASLKMAELGLVDHSESIRSFAESEEPVAAAGHLLLVDEAQDLTQAQVKIVKTCLSADACVVLVGDTSQGINVFAGATENPIEKLMLWAKMEAGLTVVHKRLEINFRSTEQIVCASEVVLSDADRALRGRVVSKSQGPPVVLLAGAEDTEYRDVARLVRSKIDAGAKPEEFAILALKNSTWGGQLATALRIAQIPFTIRGFSRDNSRPAARLLPVLQVGIGLEEFATEVEEQALILQKCARAIVGAALPDELRTLLVEVCNRLNVNPLVCFLEHTDILSNEIERVHPTQFTDKRDKAGNRIPKRNLRKINLAKSAILVRTVVEKLNRWFAMGATGRSGVFPAVGIPIVTSGEVSGTSPPRSAPSGTYVPSQPLASVARAVAVSFVNVDPARGPEINEILQSLDEKLVDDNVDTWTALVGRELSKLVDSEEKDVLVVSTIHKYKGSERPHVVVVNANESFDKVWVKQSVMEAYDGLHDADCDRRNCHCTAFRVKRDAILHANTIERKRLAHVALSRAKQTLVVSAPGGTGWIANRLTEEGCV